MALLQAGPDRPLNPVRDSQTFNPDVAVLADGTMVVVFERSIERFQADPIHVAAQRFDTAGNPLGPEIRLTPEDIDFMRFPSVTALADGGFAIAASADLGVGDPSGIFTRTFDADGTPRGDLAQVTPDDDQLFVNPIVSALPGGGYMVFYSGDERPEVTAPFDAAVFARRFDGDGTAVGDVEMISNANINNQKNAKADLLANGNTIVVWESEEAPLPSRLRAAILDEDGAVVRPLSLAEPISGIERSRRDDTDISVAALAGGGFVAVWYRVFLPEDGIFPIDVEQRLIARIFDDEDRAVSPEVVVNDELRFEPERSAVTALPDGGFVVTFDAFDRFDDTAGIDLFGQRFDASGAKIGQNVPMSSDPAFNERDAALATLDGGSVAVVFETLEGVSDPDGVSLALFDVPDLPSAGPDRLVGGDADELIEALGGDDLVGGRRGDDTIRGGDGDDTIRGNGGRDRLFGDDGDDALIGGIGKDVIAGGRGSDTLKGMRGPDVFVFEMGDGKDRITDFAPGEDRLRLDAGLFDGLTEDREILDAFAREKNGSIIFRFDGGDSLALRGVADADDLIGSLDLV